MWGVTNGGPVPAMLVVTNLGPVLAVLGTPMYDRYLPCWGDQCRTGTCRVEVTNVGPVIAVLG